MVLRHHSGKKNQHLKSNTPPQVAFLNRVKHNNAEQISVIEKLNQIKEETSSSKEKWIANCIDQLGTNVLALEGGRREIDGGGESDSKKKRAGVFWKLKIYFEAPFVLFERGSWEQSDWAEENTTCQEKGQWIRSDTWSTKRTLLFGDRTFLDSKVNRIDYV